MVISNSPLFSNAMKKKMPGDPLTKGKHMHAYKQRDVPWPGKYAERTKRLRMTCCEKILLRNAVFFRDMVYEDEKTFNIFGILHKQNHR